MRCKSNYLFTREPGGLCEGRYVTKIRIALNEWSRRSRRLPVPVAQLVELWTPCVESTRPGYENPRVRGATGA